MSDPPKNREHFNKQKIKEKTYISKFIFSWKQKQNKATVLYTYFKKATLTAFKNKILCGRKQKHIYTIIMKIVLKPKFILILAVNAGYYFDL